MICANYTDGHKDTKNVQYANLMPVNTRIEPICLFSQQKDNNIITEKKLSKYCSTTLIRLDN